MTTDVHTVKNPTDKPSDKMGSVIKMHNRESKISERESDSHISSSDVISGKESKCHVDGTYSLEVHCGGGNSSSALSEIESIVNGQDIVRESEGDIDGCMRDEDDDMLVVEMDKLLRLERVELKTKEWNVRNDERNLRKLEYESEKKRISPSNN